MYGVVSMTDGEQKWMDVSSKQENFALCLFLYVAPQLDSIDLPSLSGPAISQTVRGALACSVFSGGFPCII